LPNTLNVEFPGYAALELQAELGRLGVSVSAGAAASGGAPSHVLIAMGLSETRARSSLRFTLGAQTNGADIEAALAALRTALTPSNSSAVRA
jgi:cysteine desulfurase